MPPHPTPGPYDTVLCAEELRDALAAHSITLPSLRADLPSFAGTSGGSRGLVALGNCNLDTARRLAAVLREAAER
ncbi:hypothetical protein SAMN05216489_06002 [Streptomyces sp. 3213]|uniref:hypothetical protein n=1 Tax=Streptomyces sp. 3213.3 TaxID=1855348 RepID=UPI0008948952|nr:hypothetical protein [Streptomyces sp. 3213.3]SEE25789.1 hypothetical protein SAMN05216489_06002 [Streptomyces sp. 3213] [Streptomyces sp. 3213.3]